ncbi:MAG: hypothetical protein KAS72_14710 [Phycisphaerales bacterium]|nr:hypothetical protein [Phycisphaerales bacterium]
MLPSDLRLRSLGLTVRIALTCLVIVMLGGLTTSAVHMRIHHENRDERPGFSLDDIRGAYHGIQTKAPLVEALRRGHPDDVPEPVRDQLLAWLDGDRISEDYDNLDLGDAAPAELIDQHCVRCHARQATEGDETSRSLPLEYWDDINEVAFSREVSPTSPEILTTSTHTHALSLGSMTIVIVLLMLATRWPARIAHPLIAIASIGLLVDLVCWWLARLHEVFVPILVIAGSAFGICSCLMLAAILIDLWFPAGKAAQLDS